LIEKYLDGTLKGERLKEFEKQLKVNDELRERVVLHKEVNESIELENISNFRSKLKNIYTLFRKWEDTGSAVIQTQKDKTGFFIRHRTLVAASVAFLIVAGALLMYVLKPKTYTNDELFSIYYKPYESDISIRSDNDNVSDLKGAILLYNRNNYQLAYEKFNEIIEQDNDNYLTKYYLGLTCMEMEDFNTAVPLFEDLLLNWQSCYVYHAEWYLALCHLKLNDKENAVLLLNRIIRTNKYYRYRAGKILKELS
jgi:tetratricopeptide (TPR) repeat protein